MFSIFQKRIIAWALTCLAGMVVVGFVCAIFVVFSKFLAAFSTVIWPLAIAMMLSLLLTPVCDFLEKKFRFPRTLSVASLFVLVVAAAAALLLFAVPMLFREAADLFRQLPVLLDRVLERFPELALWIDENFRRGNIRETLLQNASVPGALKSLLSAGLPHLRALAEKSGAFFGQVAAAASVPIYFYYLISERRDFIGFFEAESRPLLSGRVAGDLAFLARNFRDILVAFFRGQVLVGFFYGLILAVGFGLLGVPGGIVIGIGIGMLNMVPYLGTIVGLSLILPLAFFSGGILTLFGAFGVFCVAQLTESYFLTPKIMGKRTGLHPMVIMLAIFFWATALDGLLGMVFAVPLTAFFVVFWRLFKERYLPSIVGAGEFPPAEKK